MQYDPFQNKAIEYINDGYSVIVSAPTGAGKTVIAEHVIADCIARGEKVIYTAPIKALSNQKYRDFQDDSGQRVGILTGDIVLNSRAQVLIMTTEIFRNKILEDPRSLDEYSWIIFDEIHYLDDYERGSVWEESLMFLPAHMKMLGLSATIPNIDEFRLWIESVHNKPVKIVKETERPVPLYFYYQCQGKVYDNFKKMAKEGYSTPQNRNHRFRKLPRHVHLKPNRVTSLIQRLHEDGLLPCVYFAFSRRKTEELADEMQHFNFLKDDERAQIMKLFDELCERFDVAGEESAGRIRPLIERGVGYHHAGMLPTLKEVVERLFTSRLLKVIFTTETFALGINMPARSVIFDELSKFYGKGFANLKTRDFYQMAGRAGRRSIDTEGYVFCRVNPHFIAADDVYQIIHGSTEKVYSQFNASYATVLNLYQHYKDKLYDIYPRSFHYYQTKQRYRDKAVYLMRGKVDILKELGHIQKSQLTEKGLFASKVYGYELVLSELFESGLLEKLSTRQLAVLSVGIVYEARKRTSKPPMSQETRELEQLTRKIVRRINKLEKTVGLRDMTKRCHFHLSPAIEDWIKGKDFHDILKHTNADEGEVVRYFRMTIQLLREISDGPVSDQFKDKAHKLMHLMNRGVIDSEKQLRS